MSAQNTTFTDNGASGAVRAIKGETLYYSIAGTFDALVTLDQVVANGSGYYPVRNIPAAANGTFFVEETGLYRLRVSEYESGTIVTTIEVRPVEKLLATNEELNQTRRITSREFDDFTGYTLDLYKWKTLDGSDAQAVAAITILNSIRALKLTSGDDAAGSMAANGCLVAGGTSWAAQDGNLVFETRVRFSSVGNGSLFVGFTDQNSSLEAPITSAASANTITTNATDAVGFMFDTSMSDDNFWLVGVANGTDAVHQDTGIAPVVSVWYTLRLEVTPEGNALFFIDDVQVGTQMLAAVTPTVLLSPTATYFSRNTTSRAVYFDYILAEADRNIA